MRANGGRAGTCAVRHVPHGARHRLGLRVLLRRGGGGGGLGELFEEGLRRALDRLGGT